MTKVIGEGYITDVLHLRYVIKFTKKEKVNKGSLSYKKIQFFETPRGYLTEQRKEMA